MNHRERGEKGSKAGLHGFTLELASREHIKQVSMPSGPGDRLLIQGYLGELEEITHTEGVLLEIRGSYGVLSVDLREDELRTLLRASGGNADSPRDRRETSTGGLA